jgi:beta-1,4-glucosyltransferase
MTHKSIAGFRVVDTSRGALVRLLRWRQTRGRKTILLFANTNFINQCGEFRGIINSDTDIVLCNDGIGMDIASLIATGDRFRANLNGTDFVPAYLRSVGRATSVFLLGGSEKSVDGAARSLSSFPNLMLAGWSDGYTLWESEANVIATINSSGADILLVALGNPLQERWILKHRSALAPGLVIGVGALFDFLSGEKLRAPSLLRRLHLEWVFRLAQEPARLWRRYTIGVAAFFFSVMLYKWRERAGVDVLNTEGP